MKALGRPARQLRYGPQQTAGSLRTTPQSKTEDGPMQSYYVGLDVHSRESVFVVENDAGVIVARGSVPTTVNGLKHLHDSCGSSGRNWRRTRDRDIGIFRGP